MVCLDTIQLTRPAESSAWHETSDDDACLALNFHTAEAKKGRLASLKTSIFGGTLHLGTHMPGLWEARETPNNNLDTAVPRANR